MTPPALPARFPARLLLKVVSLILGGLAFGLLAAIIILSIVRSESIGAQGVWVIAPLALLPALYVVKMISDSFSVLEVDEKEVRVRKWIGGARIPWEKVSSVRYWEVVQAVHGAQSVECFLELQGREATRLLRLKSSYESAAYACLIECSKARNIRVDLGPG